MNYPEFKDKRVIVTGASSGIGEAVARELLHLGAEVHAFGRRSPDLNVASFQPVDLAQPDTIDAAVAATGGHVDSLFNCAGAVPMIASIDILKVNFLGTRLLTERVVPLMKAGGAIVNTSSDGGYGWRVKLPLILDFLAVPTFQGGAEWYTENEEAAGHAYSFGKEALNVWTLQQSAVLIKNGIRINTSSPGAVQTPMLDAISDAYPAEQIAVTEQPIGRRSSVEEQVGPLLFLNSDSASYVNGADLAVDGGYSATLAFGERSWA